jgi:hypothetical protein
MNKYQGSCLCKNVMFEVIGEFEGFFFCHCSRCRKETGSAHAANLFSGSAELSWISGKEFIKVFHLAGTRFNKSFCTHCGSALPIKENAGLLVPAGSLDCDLDVKPSAHIFMGSKANWDSDLESVPKFETFPAR